MSVVAAMDVVSRLVARLDGSGAAPQLSLVADRSNTVIRARSEEGGVVIARVATATSMVRIGMTFLKREVLITRSLHTLPVTRPSKRLDPGPHEEGGLVVSFWEPETLREGIADPRESGRTLASIHRALDASSAELAGELPEWGGFVEARSVLSRARTNGVMTETQVERLDRAFARAEGIVSGARERSASFQVVHGDAHSGNVLNTARGAVWADWEDAFVGPVEFDLACLRSRLDLLGEDRSVIEAMTEAYDAPYNPELVRDLALVRNVQVIPWLSVFAERDPSLKDRIASRVDRLPPHSGA